MIFDDDEPIVVSPNFSAFEWGRAQVTVTHKPEAPLEETELKVLIDLMGLEENEDRPPVDLVMVLDVSGSMTGEKMEKLKIAMQFLIKKLSPIDRLSVVTFSRNSMRLFPLRQITDKSQDEIIAVVNALEAHGGTNMTEGLQTGLKVLEDRLLAYGRVGAIMFMSDGMQNAGGDAAQVQFSNFAVHTFGLGADHDPKVLKHIAENSKGGTFSDVQNENDLTKAFSQCLAGLVTVVVKDLNLTITQVDMESEIRYVSAGSYPQASNNKGSVTISFGELYNYEVRLVMVDLLLLPKVDSTWSSDVLQVTCMIGASEGKRPFETRPVTVSVSRTETTTDKEIPKVILEENRLGTVKTVKEARVLADNHYLDRAMGKLDEAKKLVEGVKVDDPNQLIKTLIYELQQLSDFMRTPEEYQEKGRPYTLSFETSHDRQRYAARGDMDKLRSFATPRMNTYLEQAKKFDMDPTTPLPSKEDEVEQEILDDTNVPYYIKLAIQIGKSMDHAIKSRTLRT